MIFDIFAGSYLAWRDLVQHSRNTLPFNIPNFMQFKFQQFSSMSLNNNGKSDQASCIKAKKK